ncbi:hypothetical protein JTB14_037598 [Gonioctena quinquepunctata]|nr:hypothetical protein JTB14_037598 [Gonioctena quinquepunctata]
MLQLILWVALLAALFYYFCVKPMYYWKNKGVKQSKPVWLFGDSLGSIMGKESFFDMMIRCYNQFPDARYSGFYQFVQPNLMIRDPELLKQVAVKDFEYFTDHKSFTSEDDALWGTNLFTSKGQKWRHMRPILSPSFTSSKMRSMFVLISDCAENFVQHFLKQDQDCMEMEMKDTFSRFTNDVIATTAFGVEVDSMAQPNNEFYVMGKEATDFSGLIRTLKTFGYLIFPKIFKILKISFGSNAVNSFFYKLVNDNITTREEKNIIRFDMIHLMMEAKKGVQQKEETVSLDTGFATVKEADFGKRDAVTKITNTDITAQALVFFFAGFDTISTLMSFLSYELALNPDIQTRLRNEIEDTLAESKEKITYEAILKMKYLDMVVSESLRKWPSVEASDRVCTKPYTLQPTTPDEEPVHLEKNDVIMIPIIGLHRDPKHYPEPDRFDPERFNDENKGNINPLTYLPFGLGPRNCIGSRFALLEAKIVTFHILSQFEFVPVKKTPIPLIISKKTFNMAPEGGFWLGMKRLKK